MRTLGSQKVAWRSKKQNHDVQAQVELEIGVNDLDLDYGSLSASKLTLSCARELSGFEASLEDGGETIVIFPLCWKPLLLARKNDRSNCRGGS
jgi:hypothetical protein